MDFTDGAESVQFGVIPTQHTIERKNYVIHMQS